MNQLFVTLEGNQKTCISEVFPACDEGALISDLESACSGRHARAGTNGVVIPPPDAAPVDAYTHGERVEFRKSFPRGSAGYAQGTAEEAEDAGLGGRIHGAADDELRRVAPGLEWAFEAKEKSVGFGHFASAAGTSSTLFMTALVKTSKLANSPPEQTTGCIFSCSFSDPSIQVR